MTRNQFLTRLVVVIVLSSVVGASWGQSFLRTVSAKVKPAAKRAARAKPTVQSIKPAVASCPTIKVQPLSLFAQDYSSGEGLGVRHGDVETGSSQIILSGLPNGTPAQITLTFQLSVNQFAQTFDDQSGSIALSAASVYLAGAGSNFLIQGSDLSSEGGVTSSKGTSPLPTGILQYNVTVYNGLYKISANVEADAITSTGTATSATMVGLDFVYASFTGVNSAVVPSAAQNCPTPCGILDQQIEDTIYGNGSNIPKGLIQRYNDLLYDTSNMYCLYYKKPLVIVYDDGYEDDIGSYTGHIVQYNGLKNRINNLILDADGQNPPCPVSALARKWAVTPPPAMPLKPPCDAPGDSGPSPVYGGS